MDNDFKVVREDNTLTVTLGKELSAANAPALKDELSKYYGKGIQKVVFDASGLIYFSSGGIQAVIYADQRLGCKNGIVFVNCAEEIREVLDHVGLTRFIKFEENMELRKEYRRRELKGLGDKEIDQQASERNQALDNYAAHNDMVCYSMRLGEDDES